MKRLKPLWISLTSVFGVLAIAAVTGYFVTDNFSAASNMHFNTKTYQLVDNPDAKPEYPFRSEYDFIEYDENYIDFFPVSFCVWSLTPKIDAVRIADATYKRDSVNLIFWGTERPYSSLFLP